MSLARIVSPALPGLVAALVASGAALAQDDAAGELEQTHGSWTLRCVPRENAAPCDIVQSLVDRQTGGQVVAVSIAYSAAEAASAVQIVVPLGVHLPSGLSVHVGDLDVPGVRFARCELQGCFVEARLGDDTIAAMREAETLQLTFAITAGTAVPVGLSLEGFAAAYDALVAETTARTSAEE